MKMARNRLASVMNSNLGADFDPTDSNLGCCGNRRTTRARVRVSSVYSTCDAGFRRRQSRRRRQWRRFSTSAKPSTSAMFPSFVGTFQLDIFAPTHLLRKRILSERSTENTSSKTKLGHAFFVLRSFIKQNVSLTDRWRCVFKLYWHHVEINVSYIFY